MNWLAQLSWKPRLAAFPTILSEKHREMTRNQSLLTLNPKLARTPTVKNYDGLAITNY